MNRHGRPQSPQIRRIGKLGVRSAVLVALVIGLTGCLSIKSQGLSQPRVPGVVTIGGVVCGSDYNADTANSNCAPGNIAEQDNRAHRGCDADGGPDDSGCPGLTGDGQLLVGFRVPIGSDGPQTFITDEHDLHFDKSPTYTAQLQASFPAPPGEHWVGYLSDVRTFKSGTAAANPTGIHPEFTLPGQADGGPFPGPFHWRWVVGFRKVAKSQAGDPVACSDLATFCVDSPPQEQVANDLPAESVSDFGVFRGGAVTVGQGALATVAFPVRYLDGKALGAQNLSLTASTTVPGTSATPTIATLHAAPNSTPIVTVRVPVPVATPLGSYSVKLSAAEGAPAVIRSNTATLVVADRLAPTIRIGTPRDGARFVHGRSVRADYDCADQLNASGVRRCAGPVAPGARIDTGSLGRKTFRVDALDNAGNLASLTTTYTVLPSPPPPIALSFLFSAGATTSFNKLVVKRVPAASTVTAACAGGRCPVKRFKKARARGTVSVKPFVGKNFRPGTRIEVRVTKPGTIGAVRVITIRRSKAPATAIRCLLPGAKKPARC